jgi:DNA invertase Pin-like site-specific DNA recombinase
MLTHAEAEALLTDWAGVVRSRDERVRLAYQAHMSKSEIARLTGIARTTIDRIVSEADGSVTAQPMRPTP